MFTIGRDGDNFVLMTDCAEACGGLTKVTLTPEDARAMVEQARFLLSLRVNEARALVEPRIADTTPAPPPDPYVHRDSPAQTFVNAADEARAADAAALRSRLEAAQNTAAMNAQERYVVDQRKIEVENQREMRRIARGVSDE